MFVRKLIISAAALAALAPGAALARSSSFVSSIASSGPGGEFVSITADTSGNGQVSGQSSTRNLSVSLSGPGTVSASTGTTPRPVSVADVLQGLRARLFGWRGGQR
ncbi:hypothetical protein [Sphingomonas sp.]|uniref:hypothetical protein n=1 Tax=Sphingomonas sp. TaxID=28214 RepID=UPI001DB7CE49|nr:hypothetical protein [Sphingomonas sp.]MBX9797155.1 hypothetical protein [Sphingomonas sp.]